MLLFGGIGKVLEKGMLLILFKMFRLAWYMNSCVHSDPKVGTRFGDNVQESY